ncbi:cell division topological specificity factor MinE [Leptolyngbya sp. 'hensonii']|uniref:cell division topological specificity factor MinE n=1 Tax=Leptolyngbya sp. 'hensonii' TaxID=1922337 RepID=UPI00094FFDFB|nr:cell division topological specificity factor MinE [Leptolyngbya sp. 'hensonii']OLP15653.1 cell division topological specificity factor MinE [Leptolyngbya sp. 'hensonii']
MIIELLERLFPRWSHDSSREDVKRRLKLVLANDRTEMNPAIVAQMQAEILELVSRYVEVDTERLEFSLENRQRATTIIANLPIRRIKPEPEPQNEVELDPLNAIQLDLRLTEAELDGEPLNLQFSENSPEGSISEEIEQ